MATPLPDVEREPVAIARPTSLAGDVGRSLTAMGVDVVGAIVLALLLARWYGARSNGTYVFAIAISSLLVAICGFGLPAFTVRQSAALIAWGEAPAATVRRGASLYLQWSLPAAALASLAVIGLAAPAGADRTILTLAVAYSIVMGATGMMLAALQGARDFGAAIVASLVQRGGGLLFLLLGAFVVRGLATYVAGLVVAQVAVTLVLAARVRRTYGIESLLVRAPAREGLAALREAVPFGVTVVLEVLYVRGVAAVLGYVQPAPIVGVFGAAHTMYLGAVMPAYAASTALYPRLAGAWARDPRAARPLALRFFGAVAAYGLVAGAALYLAAPLAVRVLLGTQYGGSVPVVRLLALAVPLTAASRFLAFWLNASDRAPRASVMSALAALMVPGIGIPLCSVAGAAGAAWATVGVEATLVVSALALGATRGQPARATAVTLP